MINQLVDFIPLDFVWVFAFALAFGLALLITVFVEGDELVFMVFFMIFIGFCTWGGLLAGWIFIAVFCVFVILIIYEIKKKEGVSSG